MSDATGASLSGRGTLLFASGLVVLVMALFMLNLTIRTLTLWWYQADYVRTELEVTELTAARKPLLFGVVAATGEEIHSAVFPTELFTYDSPDDATGALKSPAAVRGLRIPIWYCPRRHSLFGAPRVYYVSEYGTLPTARTATATTAINLVVALVGTLFIRLGLRMRAVR